MLNERAWIEFSNQEDPTVREALRVFRDGEAFPKAPEEKEI
jgi:carboxyl-terminal processing protease